MPSEVIHLRATSELECGKSKVRKIDADWWQLKTLKRNNRLIANQNDPYKSSAANCIASCSLETIGACVCAPPSGLHLIHSFFYDLSATDQSIWIFVVIKTTAGIDPSDLARRCSCSVLALTQLFRSETMENRWLEPNDWQMNCWQGEGNGRCHAVA